MTPKIHYIVRHAQLITNEQGELELKIFTNQEFQHESPIIARNEAFAYYKDYNEFVELRNQITPKNSQPYVFTKTNKEPVSEKPDFLSGEAWYSLHELDLDNPYSNWLLENPDKEDLLTPFGRPAVILVKDESLVDERHDKNELPIHYNVDTDNPYDISELMMWLDEEYSIYQQLEYNTDNEIQIVSFWDPEIFDNPRNADELAFDNYYILNTPFDWSKYSLPNWWNDPEFDDMLSWDQLIPHSYMENISKLLVPDKRTDFNRELAREIKKRRKSHEERIKEGEGRKTEFKPELIGHSYDKARSFHFEAVKTICAFLNARGGFLYIGVNDKDGAVTDTKLYQKSEDEYSNEATAIINKWFKRGVVDKKVTCKFATIHGKRVFVIKVRASHKPIFLKVKEEGKQIHSEFYIRRDASSRLLHGDDMIDYIESHWWNQNYKRT